MKKIILSLILLIIALNINGQFNLSSFEPKSNNINKIINFSGYIVGYDQNHCIPVYSLCLLTKKEAETHVVKRYGGGFINNKDLLNCINKDSYREVIDSVTKKSKYDIGHLTNAEDETYSGTTEQECFNMANMCPQLPGFNRGIWKKLEGNARTWAEKYDSTIIISGPIISSCKKEGKLIVPLKFYKVIYFINLNSYVAFIFDNAKYSENESVFSHSILIENLETLSGNVFIFDKSKQIDLNKLK